MDMYPQQISVTTDDILEYFPIKYPYKFIDHILEVNEHYIVGDYLFKDFEFFYEGHFPGNPIIPGTILQESAAQIGLVAFGMHLIGNQIDKISDLGDVIVSPEIKKLPGIKVGAYIIRFYLVDSQMRFKKVVQPGERIIVKSTKSYFKLNKIKCEVVITKDLSGETIAKGFLSGMIHLQHANEE